MYIQFSFKNRKKIIGFVRICSICNTINFAPTTEWDGSYINWLLSPYEQPCEHDNYFLGPAVSRDGKHYLYLNTGWTSLYNHVQGRQLLKLEAVLTAAHGKMV